MVVHQWVNGPWSLEVTWCSYFEEWNIFSL